jgi:hypothetical protein
MQFRTTSMRRAGLPAVAAALTLVLAACGGSSSGSSSSPTSRARPPVSAGEGTSPGSNGSAPTGGNGQGSGRGFDPQALQSAVNDFTACLRNQGLAVNDITIGANRPQGSAPDGGEQPPRSFPNGSRPSGSRPTGSFPPGSNGQGAGRPGGFNFTNRILQQLGLDTSDANVAKAVDACKSTLQNALPNFGQGRRGASTTTTQT